MLNDRPASFYHLDLGMSDDLEKCAILVASVSPAVSWGLGNRCE